MLRKTKEQFDKIVKDESLQVFTQEEVSTYFSEKFAKVGELEKSVDGEGAGDTMKEIGAEIKHMVGVQVISAPDKDSFDKSLKYDTLFIRGRVFTETEEDEIIKSEDGGEDKTVTKRIGTYCDTPLNQELGRVGETFTID